MGHPVLLMLSYSLYNSIIVTWCVEKGVNLVYMVDQTNTFQVKWKDSKSIPEVRNFSSSFSTFWGFNLDTGGDGGYILGDGGFILGGVCGGGFILGSGRWWLVVLGGDEWWWVYFGW